jgi:hypothetical protein
MWGEVKKVRASYNNGVVVRSDKEASQTRPSVAFAPLGQAPWIRAARPDSLGRLGTGSSLRKERLFRMTVKRQQGLTPFTARQ